MIALVRTRPLVSAAWILLAFALPARSVEFPVRSLEKPYFLVDAVALPAGTDSARVDLTWEIPYRELVFRREGEYHRARYDVGVVFARGDEQVFGTIWDRRVRTRSFEETRDTAKRAKGRKLIHLPSGKYDVRITMTDRTSLATSIAVGKLEADFGDSRIGLSDLRFVRYTVGNEEVANPGRDVPVGESGHVVRVTLHPEAEAGGVYLLKWRFTTTQRKRVAEGDTSVVVAGEPIPLEFAVPSDQLTAGVYHLDVSLEGSDGESRERRKARFVARLTPAWFVTHRDEALDVFRMIAVPDELEPLEKGAEETWAERVRAFWAGRDPSPESPENEFREEIQSRMEAAATWFDEPFRRPGWKTDRGRILLRHGHPDRRTATEADFDGPARELWEYDAPRQVFLFVDERGAGEFWLRY
jgi:GWxTD domain-containing protein